MQRIDTRQRNRLAQKRRTHAACHHTHLRAPDMHAIAMPHGVSCIYFQTNKLVARIFLALDQCGPPDEIIRLGFQRHRKADACLKGNGTIGDIKS